jgi:hypothetical protein
MLHERSCMETDRLRPAVRLARMHRGIISNRAGRETETPRAQESAPKQRGGGEASMQPEAKSDRCAGLTGAAEWNFRIELASNDA